MRYPYEHEETKSLRQLVRQVRRFYGKMSAHDFAANVTDIWNTATCPFLLRSESEHRTCKRIARMCIALIRRHSLPVRELSNGCLVAA